MGFFEQRAAQVASETERKERTRATARPRKAPEPTEPEHCRAPGRTVARPVAWPDEQRYPLGTPGPLPVYSPNWSSPEWPDDAAEAPVHRATHGRRLAVRLCPVCHEQRSSEGQCWCGSDEAPARVGWRPTAERTPRVRTVADREPAWWAAHRRLHPIPGSNCQRCQVAHGLAD